MDFDYLEAFSRNIGLLTQDEQSKIRSFTIAIPGMGGVGGSHLISCVRHGFEKFKIADLDVFELKNLNRQYGANLDTLGKPKTEVMKNEALRINPLCSIETFDMGINTDNISFFLKDVNFVIDALDAFAIEERRLLINTALELKIPVISAAPIGFGSAFIIFLPEKNYNFDSFFNVSNTTTSSQKILSFFTGLVPALLQRTYMHNVNLRENRGPSSIGAVNISSGVSVIYAIKVLLNKGTVKAVPYCHQFDIMRERYVISLLPFGNKGFIQKIKLLIGKHMIHHVIKD